MNLKPFELEDVLPPHDVFPSSMPRYPNLWFFVEDKLVLRRQYQYAVRLIVQTLEQQLHMVDDFVTGIQSEFVRHLFGNPSEGADFQMRVGPFHPYVDSERPERSHRHQVHSRFYVTPLIDSGSYEANLSSDRTTRYLVIAASVHYEVATEDPLHPYVDSCPMCGITGGYDVPIQPDSEDYCIKIHDPLGIEFILHGTIRGEHYPEDVTRPYTSISDLACGTETMKWEIIEFAPKCMEPAAIGCVFVRSGE
jgi:hypothetical protein